MSAGYNVHLEMASEGRTAACNLQTCSGKTCARYAQKSRDRKSTPAGNQTFSQAAKGAQKKHDLKWSLVVDRKRGAEIMKLRCQAQPQRT